MQQLVLICGRSGSGKNYICDIFGLKSIPSYTTRQKREKETDGVEHIFVSLNTWTSMKQNDMVAASTFFAGNYYWSTVDQLNDQQYNVYIVDPRGLLEVLNASMSYKFFRPVKIVVIFSSLFTRIKNMRKRGDSWKAVFSRIINDRKEFKAIEKEARKKKYISLYL